MCTQATVNFLKVYLFYTVPRNMMGNITCDHICTQAVLKLLHVVVPFIYRCMVRTYLQELNNSVVPSSFSQLQSSPTML